VRSAGSTSDPTRRPGRRLEGCRRTKRLREDVNRLVEAANGAVGRVAGVGRVDGAVSPVGVAEPEVQVVGPRVVDTHADPDLRVA